MKSMVQMEVYCTEGVICGLDGWWEISSTLTSVSHATSIM
jgi:hypothetical protein